MFALLACVVSVPLCAQLRAQAAPAPVPTQNAAQSGDARSRELNKLFDGYWQDKLKHNPEYATYLGDKRYDSELTDYSPAAVNEALSRGRQFIERLSGIDTTGLPQQERLSAELLLRSLIED
jgi:uncharacterized protein (DUF885 family)